MTSICDKKVVELKKEAKKAGIPKYSSMRKAELCKKLEYGSPKKRKLPAVKKSPAKLACPKTVAELKKEAKKAGIPKAYAMNKSELCKALGYGSPPKRKSPAKTFNSPLRANNLPLPRNICVATDQGRRQYMEDTHVYASIGGIKMYGVFDGHGGDEVSKLLIKKLPGYLADELKDVNASNTAQMKKAIKNAYLKLDSYLYHEEYESGSTAIVVLEVGLKLYFINLGDSRALLVRDGKVLHATKDHKPGDAKEKARIEKVGGYVATAWGGGPPRVDGYLAVSRAFGDRGLKRFFTKNRYSGFKSRVSPEPEIAVYNSPRGGDTLILATDGLWDGMINEQVAEIAGDDCNKIMKEGMKSAGYTGDNITVMVVSSI